MKAPMYSQKVFGYVLSLFLALAISAQAEATCHGKKKYVKGGLCEPGNGSKEHPWNSLALADADTSWNTLIVLASPVELVGGLNMRPGTCLIGEKNPVNGPTTGDQCVISNPNPLDHNGNCIEVVSGDVCIKNIYFREIWNSAIDYDNARNLTVENVLVTGYNKGLNTSLVQGNHFDDSFTTYVNGALNAQNSNNGKTSLCNVVIRDNYSGAGIYEEVNGGAKRKIRINKCEFSGLTNGNPNDGSCAQKGLYNNISAVMLTSFEQSKVDTKIKNTFIHDFDAHPIAGTYWLYSIFVHPFSSTSNTLIENCIFINLPAPPFDPEIKQCAQANTAAPYNPLTGWPCCDGCTTDTLCTSTSECTSGSFVNPAPAPGGIPEFGTAVLILPNYEMQTEPEFVMNGTSIIRNCVFENPPSPFFDINHVHTGVFMHPMSTHSWTHIVENNIFKNIDISCGSTEMGSDVNLTAHVRHNTSQGGFIFCYDSTAQWANMNDPSTMVVTYHITKNKWSGAPGSLAAIQLQPNLQNNFYAHSQWVCSPYQNCTLNVTDNCFEVPGPTVPGLLPAAIGGFGNGVSGCDAGTATVYAEHNNFIGFEVSVNELALSPVPCKPPRGPLNINYLFGTNYWGGPVPPALTEPGYTGTLNTGTASPKPFPCPKFPICP